MADLFEPGDGITLVERGQQFQHATCSGRKLRLARYGELLLEAGADDANR